MAEDLLVIAGDAAAVLERYGLVACGRRENGAVRVDFWTRDGVTYRHDVLDPAATVEDVVAACLALADVSVPRQVVRRISHLS